MEITPKTPWKERRIKSGSFLDRKLSADILKVRRAHDSNIKEMEKRTEYNAFMLAGCVLVALVLMCCCAKGCKAYTDQDAINAVIGEAEGEGYNGMLAVSGAIRNRGTLHGVYGLHAPRVTGHKYSLNTLQLATRAWNDSMHIDASHGAKYWEGTAFPLPYWARNMQVTAIIGNQKFFKEAGQ